MKNKVRVFMSAALALSVSLIGGLASAQQAASTTPAKTYITNWDIATNAAIAYSKLKLSGQITSKDIKNKTIKRDDIAKQAVSNSRIKDGAVDSEKIKDGSVKQDDLASGSVDTENIVDGAVTSAKIANGTIVNADVSASAAIAGTKINPDFGSQDVVTTGDGYFDNLDVYLNTNTYALFSTHTYADTIENNYAGSVLDIFGSVGVDMRSDADISLDTSSNGTNVNINTGTGGIALNGGMTAINTDVTNINGTITAINSTTATYLNSPETVISGNVTPGMDSSYDIGADGTRWSTIYADTLNYTQALTDDNSDATVVTMGDDNALDTVSITANTSISDAEWEVLSNGAASFDSVAANSATIGGGYAAGGINLNGDGAINTDGNIYATKSGSNVAVQITEYQDGTSSPVLNFQKGRGTEGAPSAVLTNDVLGSIQTLGYDGSSMEFSASIWMRAKSNWTNSDHGSEIGLWTTPIGSTAQQQVLRLEEDGDVNVLAGNLLVGDGTINAAMNGEDAYIGGTLEVDGSVNLGDSATDTLTLRGDTSIGGGAGVDVEVNSNTWDIDIAGVASGFTGFTSTGWIDLGQANTVIASGTSTPGTCHVGQLFVDTDTAPYLFVCRVANVWAGAN